MLRWFARNDYAANFLMLGILLFGIYQAFYHIPLEVRPGFEVNQVRIRKSFRGATPEDVERTIVIPIERALEGMQGVSTMEGKARSGNGEVIIRTEDGVDLKELQAEIDSRIATISTFPPDSEPARTRIPNSDNWWEVVTVAVTGDMSERELLSAARQIRDELAALPEISQVNVLGDRASEISIEADDQSLIDYGLSFNDVSRAIRDHSVDLPAGTISAQGGSMMIRTKGQAFTTEDFNNIPIRASDGSLLTLGDVAKVNDGFEQDRKLVRFNGRPALLVEILRIENESAIKIAEAAKKYVEQANARLPDGIKLFAFDDDSIALRGRLGTLSVSLLQGCLLVLIMLSLFLRPAIAFWVVIGIPVSFAGALIMMPYMGITANLFSVFGFIIVLGIVVDDAIVTGENIYSKLRAGVPAEDAAVLGAKEVATPVTFGILTTIVAFIPLMFFEGWWGNFTRQIPPIVAPVLLFSLIESKLILPSHLKRLKVGRKKLGPFARFQKGIADGLEAFVEKVYQPILKLSVDHRWTTLSLFAALALATIGYQQTGKMGFVNMPSVDRYKITGRLNMADDTKFEVTDEKVLILQSAAEQMRAEFLDGETGNSLITNIMSSTGGWPGWGRSNPERGIVSIEIMPPGQRSERGPTNAEIAKRWRELVGEIPGARQFRIRTERSGSRGTDPDLLEIQLRGKDSAEKRRVATELKDLIRGNEGITSVWDNAGRTRNELQISLKDRASELGITQRDLARQVRQAFFGEQAQRIQRDQDDIRVMVRLSENQRESLHTLDTLKIRLNDGSEVPFRTIADAKRAMAPSNIERIDGAQTIKIMASPANDEVKVIDIARSMESQIQEIVSSAQGLSWKWDGQVAEYDDTFWRTTFSIIGLCVALYALLAIPFKSLLQPLFVMVAIPFGVIGALFGHVLLDITPSWLSVFGMLALAGVVVNDSLVMVDFINTKARSTGDTLKAVLEVGAKRFRPILLTSLTTFVGLVPLIFDDSLQAQFLIPMAVSLAFGILFATMITLFLIPCSYMAMEDLKSLLRRAWTWYKKPFAQ